MKETLTFATPTKKGRKKRKRGERKRGVRYKMIITNE
jgi:hypothetical protein